MAGIDKGGRLDQEVFTYTLNKDNKVIISWRGKQVMLLKGDKAEKFMSKIAVLDDKEAQLLMARMTGNFKRGNEKRGKYGKYPRKQL